MRKNILTKYLPFVAAVLLAASCGKDDNGGSIVNQPSSTEEVVQPDPNPEAPKTVTIPFSVKVNDGASLSKIQYEANGNVVSRTFESEDCGHITLDLSSTPGVDNTSEPLELSQDGEGGYVFSGTVTVESEYADDFIDGEMPLTGTFAYSGKEDNVCYSTTSLVDLEENHCNHIYKAEFKSGDDEITFVDQNAYLCFTVYYKQTTFDLTFNEEVTVRTFTPDATTHKIWIAVPCGGDNNLPTVKGTMVSVCNTDLKPGTVYKVNRTDRYEEDGVFFVDLGTNDGKWWATCNLGAVNPWDYGDYYAWGETTTKNDYSWSTYVYGSRDALTKYCYMSAYGLDGFTDELTTLGAYEVDGKIVDDDVAHVTNSNWSMPTYEDFDNLNHKCYWAWTEDYNGSGVKGFICYKAKEGDGYKWTYKNETIKDGYSIATTPHIFFPATGSRYGTDLYEADASGGYWMSSLCTKGDRYPSAPCWVVVWRVSSSNLSAGSESRYCGLPVRPVRSMNSFEVESYPMFESEKENKI